MDENQALISRFYHAFKKRAAEEMCACYHPEIEFSDPIFPSLKGGEAKAMWRMLCARGQGLELDFGGIRADEKTGSAHWEARYTFSGTGRRVHNIVDAALEFKEGKIVRHRDTFDLWRWSRMALGAPGILLGWSPIIRNAVQKKARAGLAEYIEKHPECTR